MAKAEGIRADLQKKMKNPLLDDEERSQLKIKFDRYSELIADYRKEHPAATLPVTTTTGSSSHSSNQPITIQEAAIPTSDPRPDLQTDSYLWAELLRMADEKDKEAGRVYGKDDNTLCGVLNGFRCNGTRLRVGMMRGEGIWSLQPDIDVKTAWESQSEYDDFKKRYLGPYGSQVVVLLRELTRRYPLLKEAISHE